ncbi:MAG: hypothetical protein IT495_09955 [Gammaproteobacteria bacterium]|nr:hypothetical protein [Gammaproteobacteria bacterium]
MTRIRLNRTQGRIATGAALVFVAVLVFPPIYLEQAFSGLTDGRHTVAMTFRKLDGWSFIGRKNLEIFAGRKQFEDPDDMSLAERFQAMRPTSLAALRAGPAMKVEYRVLALELAALCAITGAALYFTRDRP